MSPTWLSSILYLSTFFRCTLLWLDINLIVFGIMTSDYILWIGNLVATPIAIIFNITVCTLEHKAKKRSQRLNTAAGTSHILPAKMWVIVIDFFLAAAYMLLFAFAVASGGSGDITDRPQAYDIYNEVQWYSRGFSIIAAQTYAGVLVAWHYHLFFASVSLHSWIHGNRAVKAKKDTRSCVDQQIEGGSSLKQSFVTVQSKM